MSSSTTTTPPVANVDDSSDSSANNNNANNIQNTNHNHNNNAKLKSQLNHNNCDGSVDGDSRDTGDGNIDGGGGGGNGGNGGGGGVGGGGDRTSSTSSVNNIDKLSPDQEIFINPADGLPNEHPLPPEADIDSDIEPEIDPDSFDDLPTSIIVTNIHSEVFIDPDMKQEMEELFRTFSDSATFQWLRSFRRLRVNYDNAIAAANARIKLHQYEFNKKTVITCYFAQPVTPVSHKNLQPPAPVKQFLISPPASPPAGWEPREENEPLVNHDLLAALASLTPGESHELHPQSEDQPAIIVHTAMVPEPLATSGNGQTPPAIGKPAIVPTKCPERV